MCYILTNEQAKKFEKLVAMLPNDLKLKNFKLPDFNNITLPKNNIDVNKIMVNLKIVNINE